MRREKLVVILGPTAVGKTALSITLAKQLDTQIISGDSRLVYRGLDIGTAKPTLEERNEVIHHLIDILPPTATYNAADFQRMAGELIGRLNSQGKIPLLVGGTGLYIQALLEGYEFSSQGEDRAYRQELAATAQREGGEKLYEQLRELSPRAASATHPHNIRRIIRYLEQLRGGNDHASQKTFTTAGQLAYDALVIGLNCERQELYRRINDRVDKMFSQGLTAEVADLLAQGAKRNTSALESIGYRETAAYLAGELTLADTKELIKRNTRRFAKRQLTWYRRMPYIKWFCLADTGRILSLINGHFKR